MTTDRKDAWCSQLSEDDAWAVYDAHATAKSWEACAAKAVEDHNVAMPTRSTYYRFRERMAVRKSEHRIELAITEKARIGREMDAIGEINPELKRAFEQRALESELRGDHQGADKWMKLALALGEAMNRKIELELKRQIAERGDKALALQVKKFQKDTCELFIKWSRDKRVKEIANSKGLGTDEKVDRLGNLIFGEDW